MKILFDASIHLGQFVTDNESLRISCKNSQAAISEKGNDKVKGYYTFYENGWMDKIVWNLERQVQDTFYPFMDVFFSLKNIEGLADTTEEMAFAAQLGAKFPVVESSNLISCALAVTRRIDVVHTLYKTLLHPELVDYMAKKYGVKISLPPTTAENTFGENTEVHSLEKLYEDALSGFKKGNINILNTLHS